MNNTNDIEQLFKRVRLPEVPHGLRDRVLAAAEVETRPIIPLFVKLAVAASVVVAVTLNAVSEYRHQALMQNLANSTNVEPQRCEETGFEEMLGVRYPFMTQESRPVTDWKERTQELKELLSNGGCNDI